MPLKSTDATRFVITNESSAGEADQSIESLLKESTKSDDGEVKRLGRHRGRTGCNYCEQRVFRNIIRQRIKSHSQSMANCDLLDCSIGLMLMSDSVVTRQRSAREALARICSLQELTDGF